MVKLGRGTMNRALFLFVDGMERRRQFAGVVVMLAVLALVGPWQAVLFAGVLGLGSIILRPSIRTLELAKGHDARPLPEADDPCREHPTS